MTKFRVTILAENYASKTQLAEWGFSALIESNDKKLLFDVGFSGSCVVENAKYLGIELKDIDGIVLSHGHYDHTDGLENVLAHIGPTPIYCHPELFTERYSCRDMEYEYSGMKLKQSILENTYGVDFCFENALTEIAPGIYMSGEVPFSNDVEGISSHFKTKLGNEMVQDTFPDDNSIVLDTPKGLVIICGCAHRGIVNIMTYIKKMMNKNIYGIIGGTHLYNASDEHFNFVTNFLKQENIQLISPGHCTGINRIIDLKTTFGERVNPAFCGEEFNI